MRYKEDDFYSTGWGVSDKSQMKVMDLAAALMDAETNEKLSDNVLKLYDVVGEQLWAENSLNTQTRGTRNQQAAQQDLEGSLLDKLIEISYIVHLEKRSKKRIGHHKANWSRQSTQDDDLDFERYLSSLQA